MPSSSSVCFQQAPVKGLVKKSIALFNIPASSAMTPAIHPLPQNPVTTAAVSPGATQETQQTETAEAPTDRDSSPSQSSSSSLTGSTANSSPSTSVQSFEFDADGKRLCTSPEAFRPLESRTPYPPLFMDLFDLDPSVRRGAIEVARQRGVDEDRLSTLKICLEWSVLGVTFQQVARAFKAFGITEGEYRALHPDWALARYEWL